MDAYLNAFPIERDAEGISFSTPETVILVGGVVVSLAVSVPTVGLVSGLTVAAMQTRRMYAQDQCAIL